MDALNEKIAAARAVIEKLLAEAERPAVMCSFGKDSMVMLHLMLQMGVKLPVVFYQDPWFAQKYQFAKDVAEAWGLVVWDYQPSAVTMWEGKGIMAFTNHYQIGPRLPDGRIPDMAVPKNIEEPVEGRFYLCGLVDLFARPLGTFEFPWDMVLIGHKSADEDQIAGKVPLQCDRVRSEAGGPVAGFPLKDWTDEDVWAYTERFEVPVQLDRYVRGTDGMWGEHEDKWANSDYWHACIACIDRRNGPVVECPKLKRPVPNVSDRITYRDIVPDYCKEVAR